MADTGQRDNLHVRPVACMRVTVPGKQNVADCTADQQHRHVRQAAEQRPKVGRRGCSASLAIRVSQSG